MTKLFTPPDVFISKWECGLILSEDEQCGYFSNPEKWIQMDPTELLSIRNKLILGVVPSQTCLHEDFMHLMASPHPVRVECAWRPWKKGEHAGRFFKPIKHKRRHFQIAGFKGVISSMNVTQPLKVDAVIKRSINNDLALSQKYFPSIEIMYNSIGFLDWLASGL